MFKEIGDSGYFWSTPKKNWHIFVLPNPTMLSKNFVFDPSSDVTCLVSPCGSAFQPLSLVDIGVSGWNQSVW